MGLRYFVGVPLIIAAMLLSQVLAAGDDIAHEGMESMLQGDAPGWMIWLIPAVFAPLVEELLFRGALYGHLRSRHRWLYAGLISSVIFAAVHPQGAAAIPVLATIGMIFAFIREWRGSLIGCMAAACSAYGVICAYALMIMIRQKPLRKWFGQLGVIRLGCSGTCLQVRQR